MGFISSAKADCGNTSTWNWSLLYKKSGQSPAQYLPPCTLEKNPFIPFPGYNLRLSESSVIFTSLSAHRYWIFRFLFSFIWFIWLWGYMQNKFSPFLSLNKSYCSIWEQVRYKKKKFRTLKKLEQAYDRRKLSTATTEIRVTTAHCFDKLENTHSL